VVPRFDDPPGICQDQESRLVQALVPESSVEALDVRVLNRLARRDEVQPPEPPRYDRRGCLRAQGWERTEVRETSTVGFEEDDE
jgi:hypothetical protein